MFVLREGSAAVRAAAAGRYPQVNVPWRPLRPGVRAMFMRSVSSWLARPWQTACAGNSSAAAARTGQAFQHFADVLHAHPTAKTSFQRWRRQGEHLSGSLRRAPPVGTRPWRLAALSDRFRLRKKPRRIE